MESFGEIRYAVLCKTRGDLLESVDESGAKQATSASHKGTGFVRFVNQEDAEALFNLSKNLEDQLTEQHQAKEKNSKAGNKNAIEKTLLG